VHISDLPLASRLFSALRAVSRPALA
jgi:hypothetical protein